MIFNKEDKFYHEANNTSHICSKACVNKLGDHCHETCKYRSSAGNMCNLNYRKIWTKKRLWGWGGRWSCGEGVRFISSWILSSPKTKTKTKSESSDKIMKSVYDPDDDDHILKPKDKTKTETDPYVVVPCSICDANFKNDIALKIYIDKLWKERT